MSLTYSGRSIDWGVSVDKNPGYFACASNFLWLDRPVPALDLCNICRISLKVQRNQQRTDWMGVAKECECLNAAKTSFHYSILKSLKVVYFSWFAMIGWLHHICVTLKTVIKHKERPSESYILRKKYWLGGFGWQESWILCMRLKLLVIR